MKILLPQKNNDFTCTQKFVSGFTLIEALVAVSVFTMAILAMFAVLAGGIANTSYAKSKITAEYLAQEGIEHVRNKRDSSLITNGGQAGWGQFISDLDIIANYPTDFSGFTRSITIDSFGDEVEVISTVIWTQGSGDHNVTFSENLFNWVE